MTTAGESSAPCEVGRVMAAAVWTVTRSEPATCPYGAVTSKSRWINSVPDLKRKLAGAIPARSPRDRIRKGNMTVNTYKWLKSSTALAKEVVTLRKKLVAAKDTIDALEKRLPNKPRKRPKKKKDRDPLNAAIAAADCSHCGARGGRPCMTVRGSSPGSYTYHHGARLHAAHVARADLGDPLSIRLLERHK